MDTIASINQQNVNGSLNSASQVPNTNSNINKDEFLHLLVTQLKYQDPLNPMKNDQFIQENTMFSQLEQLTNLNQNINQIMSNINNNDKIVATDYIGKYVSTGAQTITVTNNGANNVSFNVPREADVRASIVDAKGNDVANIDLGAFSKGVHDFVWDGKNNQGNDVPDGVYTVTFVGKDLNDNFVPIEGYSGKVSSVLFQDGNIILETDSGGKINLNDVQNVSGS